MKDEDKKVIFAFVAGFGLMFIIHLFLHASLVDKSQQDNFELSFKHKLEIINISMRLDDAKFKLNICDSVRNFSEAFHGEVLDLLFKCYNERHDVCKKNNKKETTEADITEAIRKAINKERSKERESRYRGLSDFFDGVFYYTDLISGFVESFMETCKNFFSGRKFIH